jgi:hypothetical protein
VVVVKFADSFDPFYLVASTHTYMDTWIMFDGTHNIVLAGSAAIDPALSDHLPYKTHINFF